MRQLPQQCLDNMSTLEMLHYTNNEQLIDPINRDFIDAVETLEEEIRNEMDSDFLAEYDRGYEIGFNEGFHAQRPRIEETYDER